MSIRLHRIHFPAVAFAVIASAIALISIGCKHEDRKAIVLTLDWKPEPEFGGFYQAQLAGAFKSQGLEVELRTAGAGAPTWQLVAGGQADFATTAADQVVIARSHGADVVALFAVYQTFPQGIMAHKSRGLNSIEELLKSPGTLAAEDDPWLRFLLKKYEPVKVTITGYSGGIATFLAKADFSQQCFVASEPLLAQRQGGGPQVFLIADAGYNPYTTVLIARGDTIRANSRQARAIVAACREGWRQYLDDPAAANASMEKLNTEMDAQTFQQAAAAQKPLIQTNETRQAGLGTMSLKRWGTLIAQLADLKVIDQQPAAEQCFIDVEKLAEK